MKRKIKIAISIILSLFLINSSLFAQRILQIKGSDTIINLTQRLAEVYMRQNPAKMIAVTGGGSGTGIAALINKTTDIANASRLIKTEEIKQAQKMGVAPQEIIIALDGLALVVNRSNTVSKLTVEEIGKIFKGEITNWKELGGADKKITLYGRQSNSGTFTYFREEVLKGEYSQRMNGMNGNAQIIEAVGQDKSGIGYVGMGYVQNSKAFIKPLNVASSADKPYYNPLVEKELKIGLYPIIRPLNQYIDGKNLSKDMLAFIKFELSTEGQKIIAKEGFMPITKQYIEQNDKVLK